MPVVLWLLFGLGVWLVDSAIRDRPPIAVLKGIITGTPETGKISSGPVDLSLDSWGRQIVSQKTASGQDSWNRSGNVNTWIQQAMAVMQQSGQVDMSKVSPDALAIIIKHESNGNPNAINLWDSNAKAGHPSQGLMQTIPSTFRRWMLPGYTNISDPVANIIAGTRYAIGRYGSTDNVPGVVAVRSGQRYVGY